MTYCYDISYAVRVIERSMGSVIGNDIYFIRTHFYIVKCDRGTIRIYYNSLYTIEISIISVGHSLVQRKKMKVFFKKNTILENNAMIIITEKIHIRI